jgi:MinD superfamily P-loop ATPase
MKEIVIISGKGGTGKTSLTASFAVLAGRPVIADCDVDAPDLHLLLSPRVKERHEFLAGYEAVIRNEACTGCGTCRTHCRFGAVMKHDGRDALTTERDTTEDCLDCDTCARSCSVRTNAIIRDIRRAQEESRSPRYMIDPLLCEGCGVCVRFCPVKAIDLLERRCGEWMISDTRCGPMVHARLGAASENSGKLVALVRREARRIAEEDGRRMILVDGPPGIGCPVIASVTGASLVLAVTEPTITGEHDLERVLSLSRHFSIPAAVSVNKWDLNPGIAERIEETARRAGARIAGRVRYDRAVTRSMIEGRTAMETDAPCAGDIRRLWQDLAGKE